jgi:outer membrane receptor protein involved in Fe transport
MALGQAASAEPPRREDIVVTGERTKRTLRDTASSVVVVRDRQIEAASADRVEQILDLIPNVQLSSGGEGPTIRGQDTTGPTRDLPAFLGGTRPRATLIVDGRAVSFNEFVFGTSPLWDVERIEVFRTPQTTTQGRNSIAGAIFVTTRDPTFTPEYRVRAIIGGLDMRQVSAAASGPLVTGQLAWRLSGDYRTSRGSSRIADIVAGTNPNHDRYGLLRFKLLATPAALPGSRIEFGYAHTESKSPQVEGVRPPFRERRDPFDGYGTFHTNVDSATASFVYDDGGGLALNAVLTGGDNRARRFAPAGLGVTQLNSRDWSGEAVASWSVNSGVKIVGGVSHYHAGLRQFIDLSQLSGIGRFRDRQDSNGLFGEASWSLFPRLILTTGLRYQRDRQVRTGALGTRPGAIPLDYDRTFAAWLPKLSLSYDFTRQVRAGVLVQRAYNPGGTTLRFDTGSADNFEAEKLWDFELFARASLLRDALQLSGNLFYYDQRDAQRANPIAIIAPTGALVTFADLFNVPKAHSYGLEASVDWRVTPRLSLRGGLGLLRTRITDAGSAPAFDGREFQRSPHFSASVALDWQPLDRLRLSAELHHNSAYFSDDLETASRRVGGWTKLDARAEWDAGKFRLFGYARNVFDKFYLTYLFNTSLATAGDPRELGAGIEARF